MPELTPFKGLRFDVAQVGELSAVVAPPYDVIGPELQAALHEKHPCNVIRLILGRDEPGDTDGNDRYSRAARLLKQWQREGILRPEPAPAFYVYHQVFTSEGTTYTRRGVMGRVRLELFGTGRIYPHEETHASAKEDRLKLTKACRANLSQIFGIYDDAASEVQERLEATLLGVNPIEATDHLGVIHRVWPVTDDTLLGDVATLLADKAVYVADGHHRYETACNYREYLRQTEGIDEDHPANFVLMMLIGMQDPGMIVLPTHRLLTGLAGLTGDALRTKLAGAFKLTDVATGAASAHDVWAEIDVIGEQDRIGLYTAADDRWQIATLTDAGRDELCSLVPNKSEEWRSLGVAILHRLLLEARLGRDAHTKPTYVHTTEEVVDGLTGTGDTGVASAGPFDVAALVMPATLDHIQAVSEQGERMPAKSTYFYPKLLSGLVINPLD